MVLASVLAALAGVVSPLAQTVLPPEYAMPAGSVTTSQPGFRVRPYQTAATHGGTLAWSEEQLTGFHGDNTADLSTADTAGYIMVDSVVNWDVSPGSSVHDLAATTDFPGIGANGTTQFTEEIVSYLEFPAAGVYTLGVNSDDGFGLTACLLNPKNATGAISLGVYDSTRSVGDSLFDVSVSQAGIYPIRLVYFQVGGGGSLSFFRVLTNSTSTNYVLINDTSSSDTLKAYATATIAPPYLGAFSYNPSGFAFTINDDLSALNANSLQVKLNGASVTVATTKTGTTNKVTYTASTLFPPKQTNTVVIQFSDNAATPHSLTVTQVFTMPEYTEIPASAALTTADIDTTQKGFLFRVKQIDSATYGVLGANNAHAEAQLAGVLADSTGAVYPDVATAGTQADGSYVVSSTINFTFDTSSEQGLFNTANGYADITPPGLAAGNGDNVAGEVVAYLDLAAGYYNFGVNASDGFRVTFAANPYDAFGTMAGLFDHRATAMETQFGVAVAKAGIYPIRLVWYCITGNASLELYTINTDGSKVLVNDSTKATAVKAYWKRTAGYGSFVKYAGPSAFVSPYNDSSDVGFKTMNVIVSDGSTNQVDAATLALAVDGTAVTPTKKTSSGLTTLTYTPTGTQLPRTTHTARLTYSDAGVGGAAHTDTWNFHLLRNYVLPTALYFEDFESTAAGPDPTVPTGWVQENYTGKQNEGNDSTDLKSDFYLGWVVADRSWSINKDFGVSSFAPQELNGVAFSDETNPLLVNHYLRAETDSRQNGPPGQIQYLTTKAYDLTGKTGIVIAFNSSYEQNQDNINGLEYTVDNGVTWNPVFYWLQGDNAGDVYHNGVGTIDVVKTMTTTYGDVAQYTDTNTQALVGGYYGFFIKAPITQALAPYIEGRINDSYSDNNTESKRIEVYHVPLADNQKSVKFRFIQAGTSSWYWAIDNWGIYSVPALAATVTVKSPTLKVSLSGTTLTFTWSSDAGTFQLQKRASVTSGDWTSVGSPTGSGSVTDTASGTQAFYRLISQ